VLDKELLEILVCPKTHKPLSLAEESLIAQVNGRIAAGQLKNAGGQPVESPVEGGLLCKDEGLLYPILDGIPVLLADEAIPLNQLGQ
jgi:uncharacterized protein YbaR (Trm112 family)